MKLNLTSLAALLAVTQLPAQTPPAGYKSDVRSLPNGVQAVCDVIGLGAVYYEAGDIVLDDGVSTTVLYSVPGSPSFASFNVVVGSAIVFGESSTGNLYRIPLLSGSPSVLANVPFNYDAVVFDGQLLVSAKTGGFGSPDNDVIAVDPSTGVTTTFAVLPGFSGALAVDAQSNVYYAIPRGLTADILSYTPAQVAAVLGGGSVLGESDASVEVVGLPSASRLAIDDDGDFFVSDFTVPALFEVSRDASGDATFALIDYSSSALLPDALVYRGLLTFGDRFEPYQPAVGLGKSLAIVESTFGSTTQIRSLTPARARLVASSANPVPVGPFSLSVQNGAPNAASAILIALQSATNPPIILPLFEQPLFFGVDLGAIIVSLGGALDPIGSATTPLPNPGFGRSFSFQGLFLDNAGPLPVVGTTDELTVDFN